MGDAPHLHLYRVSDRAEVFEFIREVFPPHVSARMTTQWVWRYEGSPFTLPDGPDVTFIRIAGKMVGLSAAFRLRMWMGGVECDGEGRGSFAIHPDYRGRDLWLTTQKLPHRFAPVQFGWTRLPPRVGEKLKRRSDPVRPLVRILDAGPLFEHLTHSRFLARIGTSASTAVRIASAPLRRTPSGVARLSSFDDRADRLWERARRPNSAMIIRDHQYLNWRYCQRPDATYNLYGIERGSELEGFLVARPTSYRGMRWGYLVDFLAPQSASDVLASLIEAALDDFRRAGLTAVTCYATDPSARRALFRAGFFPAPQRRPITFMRRIQPKRTDLAKFAAFKPWYLTAGDGDLELAP